MMRNLIILFAALGLAACSNASELRSGNGGSSFVVKNKTYDQVWNAAINAVQYAEDDRKLEVSRRLLIALQDKNAGHIEAESNISLFSWGEMVGIDIVPPHNAPEYRVRVQNLAKLKANVTSRDWETPLIAAIKKQLEK